MVRYSEKIRNTTFRQLDLFRSSGEGRERHIFFNPLERANFTHRAITAGISVIVRHIIDFNIFLLPSEAVKVLGFTQFK
jgi:hypothetical protein